MTLTVTLDPETEQAIERKAARLGISPSDYLSRLAARSTRPRRARSQAAATLPPRDPTKPQTGAELVAALKALNLPGTYGDPNIDAQTLARQLRKQAETRDWS